jgi:hypothetical protein
MYKANKIWAEKLEKEGYTVVDVGYPPPPPDFDPSPFYNMELQTIFK